ncbi:MAG: glycosyltransferase family A protein [Candidatus Omnitrophota bacterium]|nr:glycosyltransferase family 2 protein [Candidatus Omnitrophota bacterium]
MNKPFFSVIIPTYNRAQFLKIAIDSVLSQTFSDFELIIIDDGSDDKTQKLIASYYKHIPSTKMRYTYQQNKGVSAARNNGITQAQGNYICFLDSDDRFQTEKLQIMYNHIKKHTAYKIFHTEEIWYRNKQILPQKIYHKKPHGIVFEQVLKLCCVSLSTMAIEKDIFRKVGIFDETLPTCEDYDFLLRLTWQFPIYLIPQYLTLKEGGHDNQLSKKYPAMDRFRIQALTNLLDTAPLKKEDFIRALAELQNKCYIYIAGAKKRGKTDEVTAYKNLIAKYV